MKKLIISIIFSLLISLNIAFASDIGYIDYEILYKNIPTAISLQEEIDEKVQQINDYNKETNELLKQHKSKELKNALIKSREPELKKMEKEYKELKYKRNAIVNSKIKQASLKVLERRKLDIIIDKNSFVAGGIDCTQEVLEAVE